MNNNSPENFSHCKNQKKLIEKRLHTLLTSIIKLSYEDSIKYHRSWAYSIHTGLKEIGEIGFPIIQKDLNGEWKIEISCCFADTVSQARAFYKRGISYSTINKLTKTGWEIKPTFHIGHMSKGLVWLSTPLDQYDKYYCFWIQNIELIHVYKKEDLRNLLNVLRNKLIIEIPDDKQKSLQKNIWDTKRTKLDIRPGISLYYSIPDKQARDLDKVERGENLFTLLSVNKMREVLSIIDTEPSFIIKNQDNGSLLPRDLNSSGSQYLPTKTDVEYAIERLKQLKLLKKINQNELLTFIETHFSEQGIVLHDDWRTIIIKNFKVWF